MMSLPDFNYKQTIFYFTGQKDLLKFRADNIVIVDEENKVKQQHSCHRLFALFIVGNITVTSVVLAKAKKFGFPIILLSPNMKVNTVFNNAAEGNFLLKEKQYMMKEKRLPIAKQFVKQKIDNQASLISNLRYRSEEENTAISALKALSPYSASDSYELLGIEGSAGKIFFRTYFRNMNWTRREPRTKRDINNLLLDIGYTYIFNFIEAMTSIYGFDIYCGVYHTFFYQRKSLICDLVEPFRCIIDQRIRKAHNLNQIDEDDFFVKNNQYCLSYKNQSKYTKLFMKDILEYKKEIFLYIQAYYRWFIKNKSFDAFPTFKINGEN